MHIHAHTFFNIMCTRTRVCRIHDSPGSKSSAHGGENEESAGVAGRAAAPGPAADDGRTIHTTNNKAIIVIIVDIIVSIIYIFIFIIMMTIAVIQRPLGVSLLRAARAAAAP